MVPKRAGRRRRGWGADLKSVSAMAPGDWNVEVVRRWLEEAAQTLRALPNRERGTLGGGRAAWPEVVRAVEEAYGYSDAAMRVLPSAAAIARLDAVIGWLAKFRDPIDINLAWGWALGVPWEKLGARYRLTPRWMRQRLVMMLAEITDRMKRASSS